MISTTALLGPVASHVSAVASQTEGVQKASGAFTLTWLLVALPLLSAAILLLGGRRTNSWGHVLGALVPWLCFVIAAVMWVAMLNKPSDGRAFDQYLFNWIPAGSFQLAAGLRIDQLSMAFVLLITFVGSLIHTYSVAYMEHDPERRRFFGYMNLFVASMLLLVLADSYLLLFVGWEGVGLASYLLIGFWNYNPVFATAAKKAFVVNRVGDMGLAVAIFLMFATFGTVTFNGVFAGASSMSTGVATAMGLLLLLGACGKSAQFPLQSWLGDAMAGPTPVSALIHAATMVTAGVYLIVRSSPIFDVTSNARVVVAIVGGITLLFGAIVGCAKDDIKKALAASTMSQIGYMTLAAGLGPVGYVFAIFQLLTHGFFKAGHVPRCRLGHARHERPDRHAPVRPAAGLHDDHLDHLRLRLAGHHRRPAVLGLLEQGQDHRGGVHRQRLAAVGLRPGRAHRRRHHRVLHVPVVLHDLPRRLALDREARAAPARPDGADDRADDHPGHRFGRPRRRARRHGRDRALADRRWSAPRRTRSRSSR